jgi:hypothetical protein
MTPQYAIAECERPQRFRHAVEGCGVVASGVSDCYESFTLKVLFVRDVVATFARVMTETFTDVSRAAGAAVRALRENSRPPQFSACNLLSLTSDFRILTSVN